MLATLEERRAFVRKYDFSFLLRPFRDDHPKYAARFAECARELCRLFELRLYTNKPLAISEPVDALLREFISYNSKYEAFCRQVYGASLPRAEASPGEGPELEGARLLRELYKKHFYEEPPPIWREGPGESQH